MMKLSSIFLITGPASGDSPHDVSRTCTILLAALCLGAAPSLTLTVVPDGQPVDRTIPIGALVGVEAERVILHFRTAGQTDFTETSMLPVGAGFWTGDVPASAVTEAGVEYYVMAEDSATPPAATVNPPEGPMAPWMFTTAKDDEGGPQLIHVPIVSPQPEDRSVPIVAFASDSSFVAEVRVHHRAPGDGFTSAILFKMGGGLFAGEIPASAVIPPVVEYYLEAQDARLTPNRTTSPQDGAAGPLSFPIDQPGAPSITHTPASSPHNARTPITIVATAMDDVAVTEAWVFYGTGSNFTKSVALVDAGSTFTVDIPAIDVVEPELSYFLEVNDADGHLVRHPSDAPRSAHQITIVDPDPGDQVGPQIDHAPLDAAQRWRQPVTIVADVQDSSSVFAVRLNVSLVDSSTITTILMDNESGDRFVAEIPSNLVRGQAVRYFIVALDASSNANESRSPMDAPASWFSFPVVGDPNVADPNEEIPDLYTGNGCGCSAGGQRTTIGWGLVLGLGFFTSRRRRV